MKSYVCKHTKYWFERIGIENCIHSQSTCLWYAEKGWKRTCTLLDEKNHSHTFESRCTLFDQPRMRMYDGKCTCIRIFIYTYTFQPWYANMCSGVWLCTMSSLQTLKRGRPLSLIHIHFFFTPVCIFSRWPIQWTSAVGETQREEYKYHASA